MDGGSLSGGVRKPFSFGMYDLCVDEEFNHLYLSTRRHGIMRFRIVDTNCYFEDIVLDGCLDLSEMYGICCSSSHHQQQQQQLSHHQPQTPPQQHQLKQNGPSNQALTKLFPTCLTLIEDESLFKDTVRTTRRRRLVFYDRTTKQIVSIQVLINKTKNLNSDLKIKLTNNLFVKADLTSNRQSLLNGMYPSIKCSIFAGLTIEHKFPIRQMVSNGKEIICLFDDLNLINVYNLKTFLLLRTTAAAAAITTTATTTSTSSTAQAGATTLSTLASSSSSSRESLRKTTMCLTLSSDGLLYSTNGKSIFNLDYTDFKQKRRISPFVKKGENLANTFSWITILTNSKLVLLTDALQLEQSTLYILKPVNYKNLE